MENLVDSPCRIPLRAEPLLLPLRFLDLWCSTAEYLTLSVRQPAPPHSVGEGNAEKILCPALHDTIPVSSAHMAICLVGPRNYLCSPAGRGPFRSHRQLSLFYSQSYSTTTHYQLMQHSGQATNSQGGLKERERGTGREVSRMAKQE